VFAFCVAVGHLRGYVDPDCPPIVSGVDHCRSYQYLRWKLNNAGSGSAVRGGACVCMRVHVVACVWKRACV
jgi:hypothetical protein